MANVNISIELNEVEIYDKIIDKYNLDDPLSFDDIALDLTDSIKDFFKFPIKGDITVKFELNEECYIHLIPSP